MVVISSSGMFSPVLVIKITSVGNKCHHLRYTSVQLKKISLKAMYVVVKYSEVYISDIVDHVFDGFWLVSSLQKLP